MPRFEYSGRSVGGEAVDGFLEALTAEAAAESLSGRGVTPVSIREVAGMRARFDVLAWLNELMEEKVPEEELMLFSRQLHTLLRSGVPIMRALLGLQESSHNKAMIKVLQEVRASLEQGRELSACLARHPRVFSSFYLSMVRVGEMTGRMDEVFLRLFHHIEFEKTIREQVKSALRYPSLVMMSMAVAIIVINIFVIPAFAGVYKGFGAKLPLMTQLLIGFSDFVVAWWPLLAGGGILAFFGFLRWTREGRGRYLWDGFKLRIPIIGKVVHKATLSRFARSFAMGLKSGVPITQAMTVVAQTVDNDFIADKIGRMREGVERGDTVLHTAIAAGVFTPVVLQMIAVGEESGSLDDLLQEVADMYRREVEYELKNLSAQIEPVLIVFLGILVLILALGIFLPIWDLGRAALNKG